MLSRRQKDILQQLERADDFISIRTLCETCSLSEKTMLSELTVIEAILQEQEIGVLIRKRGSGVSLQLQKNKHRQYEMLLHTRQDQEEAFIVRSLFFHNADHVWSEKRFCEVLHAGRHVVHGYLRELSEFCCNYNIVIRNRQKYGILVKGDEFHIRDCIIALFMERSDYPFVKGKVGQILDEQQSKQFQELFQGFLYHPLETCVLELEKDCHVYLDHISRLNVFLHLCMCILRIQQKAFVDMRQEQMDMLHKKQRSNRLLKVFETLEAIYHILLPEQEKCYIQLYLDIYGLVDDSMFDVVREDLEHTEHFHTFVDQFLDILNGILSISIDREEELMEGLLTHLAGTIIRLKNGVRIHNPLLHEVRSSFSSIYQATWATSILFDQYYSVTITEDEIAYIALYLGVVREKTDYDLHVCLLVKRYDNVIRILREQIQKLHHAIRIDDIMTEQEYQSRKQHRRWDLVIATIDLHDDFPQIHVNEILKEEDCLYIRSIVNHILDKKILHSENNLPHADSMFDENLIFLEQSVENKEELLKQICEKLLKAGYVKEPFFSSVMQREREISTEIGSGVAIPHGNAQYVNDTVIVYAGLQKTIPWGRDEHVQHVFLPVISVSNKNEVERSIKNFYRRLIALIEHGEIRRLLDMRDASEVIAHFEDI